MGNEQIAKSTVPGERTGSKVQFTTGPKGYYLRHRLDTNDVVPVVAQIHDHTMCLAGIPAKKFYFEADAFVEAQVAVHSYYGFDKIRFTNDNYNFEVEALGAKMIYGEDSMPTIDSREPLIQKHGDLFKLKTPDFRKDGRIPYQTDILRQSMELGINESIFCGPFSLATGLRSYPHLIRDMKKDPIFVKELFKFLIDEISLPYIRFLHEENGTTVFICADAWASFPNLSPKQLEEVVLPWNQYLMQKAAEIGVNVSSANSADYCEDRVEKFDANILKRCLDISVASQRTPVNIRAIPQWHDFPFETIIEYARELKAKGKEFKISGGIGARLLRDGPVSKIVANVKMMIDTFMPEFSVVLVLSNIPADTPPEHVHAAVQAARYYGHLPYQYLDDSASFRPEPRESFAEFMSCIDSL